MHILITGAGGFLGQLLARELLSDSSKALLLSDIFDPPIPPGSENPQNAKTMAVDLASDPSVLPLSTIAAAYVFHGIMSSGSEANFELGMRANMTATHKLLEAIRTTRPGIRVIYASSQAVYGQPLPDVVTEAVVPTPQSSYGAEKMVCETLVNDYTRRGFIDGLSLRFPTISVRPGKPSAAASSFISGIIREPLNGLECVVPIEDRSFPNWVASPRVLVRNLVHALRIPSDALPPHVRQVNVPGIRVTIQEMMDALEKVGGKEALMLVREKADAEMEKILRSWPQQFDNSLAYQLGMKGDDGFESAVRDYKESLSR